MLSVAAGGQLRHQSSRPQAPVMTQTQHDDIISRQRNTTPQYMPTHSPQQHTSRHVHGSLEDKILGMGWHQSLEYILETLWRWNHGVQSVNQWNEIGADGGGFLWNLETLPPSDLFYIWDDKE